MSQKNSDAEEITQKTKNNVVKIIFKTLKPLLMLIAIIFISMVLLVSSLRIIFHNDTSDKAFDADKKEWKEFDKEWESK